MLRFDSWPPRPGGVEFTPEVHAVVGARAPRHWFDIGRNACTLLFSNEPGLGTIAVLDELADQVPEQFRERFQDGRREGGEQFRAHRIVERAQA